MCPLTGYVLQTAVGLRNVPDELPFSCVATLDAQGIRATTSFDLMDQDLTLHVWPYVLETIHSSPTQL